MRTNSHGGEPSLGLELEDSSSDVLFMSRSKQLISSELDTEAVAVQELPLAQDKPSRPCWGPVDCSSLFSKAPPAPEVAEAPDSEV